MVPMLRFVLAVVPAAVLLVPIAPPDSTPGEVIDSANVLAAVEAVVESNPSTDYPAVIIDECPFGSPVDIAAAVDAVVLISPRVLDEGATHAWVNPDSDQPGFGCWAAYDSLDEPGIFWVEVYAKSWNGGKFDGITWGDSWERVDQSEEPYLNGQLATGCLVEDDGTDRICIAQWYDASVGLQIDLELHTNDGSVTAADATTAMKAMLADLAAALAGG